MQWTLIILLITSYLVSASSFLPGCCINLSGPIQRKLTNEGFHRDLVTTVSVRWSDVLAACRILFVETLPRGVYADPYQLARLQGNGYHSNRYRVTSSVDIEAIAEESSEIEVLIWADINTTSVAKGGRASAEATLPLHARYHRAHETERMAAVYLDPPLIYLGCDWDSAEQCACAVKRLPCRSDGGATCHYQPVRLSNSATPVWAVPLGDLDDLELVVVGTTIAVTAGCALLLVLVVNKRLPHHGDKKDQ